MAVTSASVRSGSSAFCTYLRAFSLTPGMCEFTIYTSDTRQSEMAEDVIQIQYKYKYVYFNFHTISSPIKHANYKAKVEMDIVDRHDALVT